MTKLEKFLMEEMGYQQYEIEVTLEDVKNMDYKSQLVLESFIDGGDVSEYSAGEYSVKKLMEEKGFNEVASIISISNLKKDYKKYDVLYKRPIK